MIPHHFKLLALLSCLPLSVLGGIQFTETTTSAGINYLGESKGASWGDFNGDGWPDLWVSNRYREFQLFVNNTNGSFTDAAVFSAPTKNAYGAAWADFDNDGDSDIVNAGPGGCGGVCTSASINTFLINNDNALTNQASEYGLDNPFGRGRAPLWLDWNQDGLLDLVVSNLARSDGEAPTGLFTQTAAGVFVEDTDAAGISKDSSQFSQLVRFTPYGSSYLVVEGRPYPLGIYDYSTLPFIDQRENLGFPLFSDRIRDVVFADFNGDLLTDTFLAKNAEFPSAVRQPSNNRLEAYLHISKNQRSFKFKAPGNVSFDIYGVSSNAGQIFIGSQDIINPSSPQFTLSSTNSAVAGIFPHEPGVDEGIYIGFDPVTEFWEIQLSGIGGGRGFLLQADATITDLTPVNFNNSYEGELSDRLYIQNSVGFSNQTSPAGLATPTACGSVVAADFDNDMDLDIYLGCRGAITNLPNLLYENQGDGTFILVSPDGAGAAGSELGRGDSVATVDYDRDGFVDLMLTNGDNSPPFNIGPHQLFRNLGNQNNWLQIDLQGTLSNRDGIGTQVIMTSAGISQIRHQDGGMHIYTQNHPRIHFGLGNNNKSDLLVIYWPSGVIQKLYNVAANQIITVVEPSDRIPATALPLNYGDDLENQPLLVASDLVPFQFTGQAGARVSLAINRAEGLSDFIPCFFVIGTDGREVARSCQQENGLVEFSLPATGAYALWVHDDNHLDIGIFDLQLRLLQPANPAEDIPLLPLWALVLLSAFIIRSNKKHLGK